MAFLLSLEGGVAMFGERVRLALQSAVIACAAAASLAANCNTHCFQTGCWRAALASGTQCRGVVGGPSICDPNGQLKHTNPGLPGHLCTQRVGTVQIYNLASCYPECDSAPDKASNCRYQSSYWGSYPEYYCWDPSS
jgi:hypothetical protein